MPPLINQSVDGPKISVVVPCYNATGTLTRCIQSIFGQTLLPQEVFLIDDASQDGTANLAFQLKEAAPKSLRVEVIALKENRGPSAARNIGIARASGDYVALLDSDDYWLS